MPINPFDVGSPLDTILRRFGGSATGAVGQIGSAASSAGDALTTPLYTPPPPVQSTPPPDNFNNILNLLSQAEATRRSGNATPPQAVQSRYITPPPVSPQRPPEITEALRAGAYDTRPAWSSDGSLRDFEANDRADALLQRSADRSMAGVAQNEDIRNFGGSPQERALESQSFRNTFAANQPYGEQPRMSVNGKPYKQEFAGAPMTAGQAEQQQYAIRKMQAEQAGKEGVAAAPQRAKLENALNVQAMYQQNVRRLEASNLDPTTKAKARAELDAAKAEMLAALGVNPSELALLGDVTSVPDK